MPNNNYIRSTEVLKHSPDHARRMNKKKKICSRVLTAINLNLILQYYVITKKKKK